MIEVKIVADSIAPSGVRLTTFVLTYPRFIHSEFMTHRMFSRNASSSRAIPVKRQIEEIRSNPAIPLKFLQNKKGMQGGSPILEQDKALELWLLGRDEAAKIADLLSDLDVHKQYANRVMEPYAHITVVCSATEYANFFALRYHSAAQPEICELAKKMFEAYQASEADELLEGEWHLPFISQREKNHVCMDSTGVIHTHEHLLKCSVARCARVSYKNHDGTDTTLDQDLQLYERLLGATPIHASPAEHQARAENDPNVISGNYCGWTQYRKTIVNENIEKFTGPTEDQSS